MIQSKNKLRALIGFEYNHLLEVTKRIDSYYTHYRIPKKGKPGEFRELFIVKNTLLDKIQLRIKKKILDHIKLPKCVKGGVKGVSNIDNAITHRGRLSTLNLDLRSFFSTVKHHMVYDALKREDFSSDIASILTKLTTYKGFLPQGTRTSTHIANIVFSSVDRIILEHFKGRPVKYTRWVDDLAFSSTLIPESDIKFIKKTIKKHRFIVHEGKTYMKKGNNREVTKILTGSNRLEVPREMIELIEGPEWKNLTPEQQKGILNYVNRVREA